MSEQTPSKHEANKMIRVLNDKPLRYTIVVHKKDGSKIEWQSEEQVVVHWQTEARTLWLKGGSYGSFDIMQYEEGMIILCEQNPEWKSK